jgi:phosphatidate cytidylyltransferase
MSDENWRPEDERGRKPLFSEGDPTEHGDPETGLSFGTGDTGPLPHWTEPPTGEVPKMDVSDLDESDPPLEEELDVWSSFTSESPVWREEAETEPSGEIPTRSTGQQPRVTGQQPRVTGEQAAVAAREPARITIGTDPSGMPRRNPPPPGRRRGGSASGGRSVRSQPTETSGGRDMPVAVGVGVFLAALFIGAILWRPAAVLVLIAVVLGLAAVEFYDKVGEKGYRPAVVPGIAACVAAPLAAYWIGPAALPLVIAFAFFATAGGFIGARGVEAGPLPNVSITMLGVIWIGLMGSFAALILQYSTLPGSPPFGTDTLFLVVLGVVVNDIGAFFVGSAAGRTPLRQWISPSKTVEGFIGGALFTIVVLVVVGITGRSDTWSSTAHLLLLAIVISVMAPLGDLVESMFKRNLDVKDFGSIVKGHGGVLDRFDGLLFALPAVYYLTLVIEPWIG